jgi:hypothetical protein
MKIAELRLWHFRCFGSSSPKKDAEGEIHPISVGLEPDKH